MKEIIEVQEEVKIGNIILEKGDRIKILKEVSVFSNKKLKGDILDSAVRALEDGVYKLTTSITKYFKFYNKESDIKSFLQDYKIEELSKVVSFIKEKVKKI